MTRHAEMERPDEVQEAEFGRMFGRAGGTRMGKHEAPTWFLDDVLVPIDYTPKHAAGVVA